MLTDEEFFKGTLGDLEAARAAVTISVLRKDFTIDELQVIEAAAHGRTRFVDRGDFGCGADAGTSGMAARYGMAALVEVHDDEELEAALESGRRLWA